MNSYPLTLEALAVRVTEFEKHVESDFKHLRELRENSEKALELQAAEYERRLESLNNEASRIAKIQADFVPVGEYSLTRETTESRIRSLEDYKHNLEGRVYGIMAAIAVVTTLINIGLRILIP